MQPPTYIVRRILRKTGKGATSSSLCTLDAVLKFDCDDTPHGVYNEHVALKLGQVLNMPVAAGVLTATSDGQTYASLHVGSPGMTLPDVPEAMRPSVASSYPMEVAGLVAFDILIGNADRSNNFKATTQSPHLRIFAAFDHGATLLGIDEDPEVSISRLATDDLIARQHPFYGLVQQPHLDHWIDRIEALTDEQVAECCTFGKPFRAVRVEWQAKLGETLAIRKDNIGTIISQHAGTIGVRR